MATVNGLTAERMQEIIDATIIGAHITGDDLILELHDATEVNAGAVRGPQGIQGLAADVGDVKTNIRSSLPGWFLMNGAAVVNADTLYPDFWGWAPTSWKSGTTLNLPNMSDTIVEGGGTVGAITGENTKVLVAANLPPHAHTGPSHTHTGPNHTHSTPDHTHSTPNHVHTIPNHTHTINHDHPSATTSTDGGHTHLGYFTAGVTLSAGGTWYAHRSTDGPHNSFVTGTDGEHNHTLNVASFSGTSGSDGAGNTGSGGGSVTGSDGGSATGAGGTGVTSASGTANTGNGPGTSTPVSIEQKALRLNWFIYHGEV